MKVKTGLISENKSHAELYQKIVDFPLDNPDVKFPFSTQLAIANDWSLDYTHQAIDEYKRYLFLMVIAGHKVSPSDQVDQVWHQHMLYSHSYWEDFCTHTVHKKLHHWPAEGNSEFHDWYEKTIESYILFFGHRPPKHIWVDPAVRLKTRTHFIRIDKEEHWVIPKWDVVKNVNKALKQIERVLRVKDNLLTNIFQKNI